MLPKEWKSSRNHIFVKNNLALIINCKQCSLGFWWHASGYTKGNIGSLPAPFFLRLSDARAATYNILMIGFVGIGQNVMNGLRWLLMWPRNYSIEWKKFAQWRKELSCSHDIQPRSAKHDPRAFGSLLLYQVKWNEMKWNVKKFHLMREESFEMRGDNYLNCWFIFTTRTNGA